MKAVLGSLFLQLCWASASNSTYVESSEQPQIAQTLIGKNSHEHFIRVVIMIDLIIIAFAVRCFWLTLHENSAPKIEPQKEPHVIEKRIPRSQVCLSPSTQTEYDFSGVKLAEASANSGSWTAVGK